MPRVIDCHVHLYPDAVNRDPAEWAAGHGEPHWATLCTRKRKDGRAVQGFPSVEELLAEMDRAGVERAVLLGWYWERAENCAAQNRFFAECVRAHPDRLSAFATVQPAAGAAQAVAEMRRAGAEGLCGLGELSPHAQGYAVAGAEFGAVLAVVEELGWPVNLHVTDARGPHYPGRVETPPGDFVKVARSWPAVRFILAHWGGGAPFATETGGFFGNVYYDTAASPLLYGAGIWREFLKKTGAARVLFGSDYPLNNYPRETETAEMGRLLAEVRGAGLNGEELAALLEGTARDLGMTRG
ncbi:MAG: amidohydrolase [Undibacterium sp.]|nr:amidohydrolase [Opitutaceae bacterium]